MSKKRKRKPQLVQIQQKLPEKKKYSKSEVATRLLSVMRSDAWQNLSSGFGMYGSDPVAETLFSSLGRVQQIELEELYQDDWVAAKIVDAPAEDMTRLDPEFITDSDEGEELDTDQIEKVEERLKQDFDWMGRIYEAECWARLYGGNLMLFFFDDGFDMNEPLNINTVRGIHRIENVNRFYSLPVSWYPNDHEKAREPEHYVCQLLGMGSTEQVYVHESRTIRFDGRQMPPNIRYQNQGWGNSSLQKPYEAIRRYQTASQSSASTMQDFVFKTLKIANLAELVMENDDNTIVERIIAAAAKLTTHNIGVYGDDEELTKQSTTVTGLADLWDRHSEEISAAADIPRSRFFSSESGALGGNAADTDLRNYYDRISLYQERKMRPAMQKFIEFLSYVDKFDPNSVQFRFKPLWMPSKKEIVETRYQQAQTDAIYIDRQVLLPEEVTESRFGKRDVDLDSVVIDEKLRAEQPDPEELEEDDPILNQPQKPQEEDENEPKRN